MNDSTQGKHSPPQQQQIVALSSNIADLPPLYVITPTYTRGSQKPDLTRLAQTLMLVPRIHWFVVEDAAGASDWVKGLLRRSGIKYTHLYIKTPQRERIHKV